MKINDHQLQVFTNFLNSDFLISLFISPENFEKILDCHVLDNQEMFLNSGWFSLLGSMKVAAFDELIFRSKTHLGQLAELLKDMVDGEDESRSQIVATRKGIFSVVNKNSAHGSKRGSIRRNSVSGRGSKRGATQMHRDCDHSIKVSVGKESNHGLDFIPSWKKAMVTQYETIRDENIINMKTIEPRNLKFCWKQIKMIGMGS